MKVMNIQPRNILFLLLQFFLIINVSCGRNDPETINNNPTVQSLQAIAVYNLDIPEPSGIAYNSKKNSLFVVSDGRTDIYEIDFTGLIKGTIPTTSPDLEGITLSANCDTIYVVEETNQLVVSYLTTSVHLSAFPVNVATNPSHALEGITINNLNGHLIVLNEKLPCMLLEFNNSTEIRRKEINYTIDISDVFFEQSSNNYWIVSHESQKILKLSSDFNLISEWTVPIIQAEGITIVQDKIYIVSDSESKMFVFQKPI
jgi:uncharacterized protein YjiK